jgi:hypothetical protein
VKKIDSCISRIIKDHVWSESIKTKRPTQGQVLEAIKQEQKAVHKIVRNKLMNLKTLQNNAAIPFLYQELSSITFFQLKYINNTVNATHN